FEAFHPDRMAGRILGMGDVLTLIEKAEEVYTKEQAEDTAEKLLKAEFTLEDFLAQMQQMRKMGPLQGLLGMIPGIGRALKDVDIDDNQVKQVEAVIQSMTLEERRNPALLDGSRKKRVARGSGRSAQEVNDLLRSFAEMRKMMRQLGGAKGMKALKALRGMDPEELAAGMSGLGGPGDFGAPVGVGAGAGGGGSRQMNKRVPPRKKRKKRR
ncbi:MAG: signal recognition particle protein, partial [Egibacteraceae bacterium]